MELVVWTFTIFREKCRYFPIHWNHRQRKRTVDYQSRGFSLWNRTVIRSSFTLNDRQFTAIASAIRIEIVGKRDSFEQCYHVCNKNLRTTRHYEISESCEGMYSPNRLVSRNWETTIASEDTSEETRVRLKIRCRRSRYIFSRIMRRESIFIVAKFALLSIQPISPWSHGARITVHKRNLCQAIWLPWYKLDADLGDKTGTYITCTVRGWSLYPGTIPGNQQRPAPPPFLLLLFLALSRRIFPLTFSLSVCPPPSFSFFLPARSKTN